jgi:FkbM family methyltransferase
MIDVGACTGGASLPFLEDGWTCFAIEPDRQKRSTLDALSKRYPNLVVVTEAMSDKARTDAPFYTSPESKGISSLLAFRESHEEADTVNVSTLEAFCRTHRIHAVNLLKVDAEGYDLPVLKGFPWDAIKPDVVVCEFDDTKTNRLGYSFVEMCEFLASRGYSLAVSEWAPIEQYGARHEWIRITPYPCTLTNPACWGNVLAFREPVDGFSLATFIERTAQKQLACERVLLARARQRLRDEKSRSEAFAEDLAALRSSRSWRLTRPLRVLTAIVKGTRNGGRP